MKNLAEPSIAGDRMLRTSDLARALGVDVTTIRRWCKTIGLPCVRLKSKQRRFRLSEVRAWYRAALDEAQK